MTFIIAMTLNKEESLADLNNGALLILLFYGQLILILINIGINRTKINILGLKKILDGELIIKSAIFFIYNIILPNINQKFDAFKIYVPLGIVFIINIGFLIHAYKYSTKSKIEIRKNNNIANSNYSLSGIILYLVAIGLYRETESTLLFKIGLFVYSINILDNNLKMYYSITSFKNKIIVSLIIGAIINITIFIYLHFWSSGIDRKTFSEMKYITFIISSLFIIPYLKKSQFSKS